MAIGICKVGDVGEGVCRMGHPDVEVGQNKPMTTELITGSSNVHVNSMDGAIVSSIGNTDCGHQTEAIVGSSNLYINGLPVHRLGDTGIVITDGDYMMITSSNNVHN